MSRRRVNAKGMIISAELILMSLLRQREEAPYTTGPTHRPCNTMSSGLRLLLRRPLCSLLPWPSTPRHTRLRIREQCRTEAHPEACRRPGQSMTEVRLRGILHDECMTGTQVGVPHPMIEDMIDDGIMMSHQDHMMHELRHRTATLMDHLRDAIRATLAMLRVTSHYLLLEMLEILEIVAIHLWMIVDHHHVTQEISLLHATLATGMLVIGAAVARVCPRLLQKTITKRIADIVDPNRLVSPIRGSVGGDIQTRRDLDAVRRRNLVL